MSEEAQKFLEALRDYILPLSGPLGVGVGYVAGQRKTEAEARKLESEASAVALDSMTKNFKILIDGYETKVSSLIHEIEVLNAQHAKQVGELKDEIVELRKDVKELQEKLRA